MQNDEQTSLLRSSFRQSSLRASIRHIEQISQNAHRLLDDVEEDTDSVNGLLLQDDYSVGSGIEDLFDNDGIDDDGKGDNNVTLGELQFLSNRNSNLIPSSTTSYQDIIADTLDSRKDKLVDRMGEQLLNAPNIESQNRLLRKSLRLDTTTRRNILEMSDTTTATTTLSTTIPTQTRQVSVRVHESTKALRTTMLLSTSQRSSRAALLEMMHAEEEEEKGKDRFYYDLKAPTKLQIGRWITITLSLFLLLYTLLSWAQRAVGPPRLPVGEYKIIEAQVGQDFFNYYEFYSGKDSAGSNGYNLYVSREVAEREDIVRVVTEVVDEGSMVEIYEDDSAQEVDWLLEDLEFLDELKRKKEDEKREAQESAKATSIAAAENTTTMKDHLNSTNTTFTKKKSKKKNTTTRHLQNRTTKLEAFNPDPITNVTDNTTTETFVYLSSSPTEAGPRNSIRLEGRRRFNRGLFIIDLRHMPAGCGTWPAFWLTDEANWPVNGEIDIVEGVNYQDTAKTALHTTKECRMDDVPEGSKTGTWDTAVGIPDKKTGIPDMTFRYAEDCFVYDPHQWINQGCVATDLKLEGRSLGVPLNKNGGGVYALEWDPTNTHIRTWVFSPHGRVPRNLRDAMRTATNADESLRVAPDTTQWGLPYGHFPIGEGTNCPAEHFRNMRLVINLAFCGSVAGTRYFMDCPKQFKSHKTCEKWVDSDPDELKEAYWKIRGVYVYEREWQKQWT